MGCHLLVMGDLEERLLAQASSQRYLIARAEALELGASDGYIKRQLARSRWQQIHAGVYQVDRRQLTWRSKLMAGVLACGPGALVSHRSALVLWGLDGIRFSAVELTVPYSGLPIPEAVLVHRTRRGRTPATREGIPVTTVERTLLDCSAMLPRMVIAKALDSAIRRRLATVDEVYDVLVAKGGRGVKGTKALRWVVRERLHESATGSGAEFELLYHMQMAFLPRPELQHSLVLEGGRRVPDFYWPDRSKAVEVDGVDAHSSADRLDDDLKRQNELMDMGIDLRRFSAREVRRNPERVVAQIRRFLET